MLIALALSPNGELYQVQLDAIQSVSPPIVVSKNLSMRIVGLAGSQSIRILDNLANADALASLVVDPAQQSKGEPGTPGKDGADGKDGVDGKDGDAVPLSSILDAVYPIGALYLSADDIDPAKTIGFGTWEPFKADTDIGVRFWKRIQ